MTETTTETTSQKFRFAKNRDYPSLETFYAGDQLICSTTQKDQQAIRECIAAERNDAVQAHKDENQPAELLTEIVHLMEIRQNAQNRIEEIYGEFWQRGIRLVVELLPF